MSVRLSIFHTISGDEFTRDARGGGANGLVQGRRVARRLQRHNTAKSRKTHNSLQAACTREEPDHERPRRVEGAWGGPKDVGKNYKGHGAGWGGRVSRLDWKSDSRSDDLLARYIFSITSLECISITTMALNFRRSRWLSSPLMASEYLLSAWFRLFRSFFSGRLVSTILQPARIDY